MADKTGIEWAEATWNPIVGCSIVSPGCRDCYAMRDAHRLGQNPKTGQYEGLTKLSHNNKAVWTGEVRLVRDLVERPLRWRRPRTIFVNSMGDLFHENVPDKWIDRVFAVMQIAQHHRFLVLTKRAERMCEWIVNAREQMERRSFHRAIETGVPQVPWPLPNVWLGVSVEDQKRAEERVPHLLNTPCRVAFVSAEPLLGPLDLTAIRWGDAGVVLNALHAYRTLPGGQSFYMPRVQWVIAGGESGPTARPSHPDWFRSLRDQCANFKAPTPPVPFFFKQWGEWVSVSEVEGPGEHHRFPDGATVRRTGKKRAGRTLNGLIHEEMPA